MLSADYRNRNWALMDCSDFWRFVFLSTVKSRMALDCNRSSSSFDYTSSSQMRKRRVSEKGTLQIIFIAFSIISLHRNKHNTLYRSRKKKKNP